MQKIRRMSGDGTHVVASKIYEINSQDNLRNISDSVVEVDEKTANKVKLLNTTKRIR